VRRGCRAVFRAVREVERLLRGAVRGDESPILSWRLELCLVMGLGFSLGCWRLARYGCGCGRG
jgi:hypothetical protein